MSCEDTLSYEQLVEGLLELFDKKESVVIEEVQAFVNRLEQHLLLCIMLIVKLRSRSRTQVRSRSGHRSGPKGPRTKDQRPGPGLTLNLVCHHSPPTTTKLFLER